jgi:hypothetical protein
MDGGHIDGTKRMNTRPRTLPVRCRCRRSRGCARPLICGVCDGSAAACRRAGVAAGPDRTYGGTGYVVFAAVALPVSFPSTNLPASSAPVKGASAMNTASGCPDRR